VKGGKANIKLKKKSTPYWVKVPENKLTAGNPIETVPLPEKVIIPLNQHKGAPCKALVKRGDKVLTCQKIADSSDFIAAPVHATVSGEVSDTIVLVDPNSGRKEPALLLTSDGKDKHVELPVSEDPEELSPNEILTRVREAGIVGLGGAVFPSHVKLAPPEGRKIDTVILNGCECEPYLTSDHRVMLEYGDKVLSGLSIICRLLSPDNIFIAIEDNKVDAADYMGELIRAKGFHNDFKIIILKSRYPVGGERVLIETILGRQVPINGLPLDVGVVVHNVSTAKAIHDAIVEGKPLIEGVVTVTGAVKNPKNLLVRVGTPLRSLINYCGGIDGKASEVILGGPMMGVSQIDLDFPVTKGTRCLLVKETIPIREQDCVSCGRCLEVCAMRLAPTLLAKYAKAGRYEDCKRAYIDECCDCGACAYICPANIPILQYIKIAKRELARRATKR
jgi:electron transport complex protein RnfC